MAQQRLYTEEQVIQAMILSDTICASYDRILDRLTPIELPSDEEIEYAETQMSINMFELGAKWMRDQILNK